MLGGNVTHGYRRDSYTEIVGGGNDGSAKTPTGTAITSGCAGRW